MTDERLPGTLLLVRPFLTRDLEPCAELAHKDGARGPLLDPTLLARIHARHQLIGRVIEVRGQDGRLRVVGYGLSGLADPVLVTSAHRGEMPDFVATLLHSAAAGKRALFDRCNGAGLPARGKRCMVVLNFVIDPTLHGLEDCATALLHAAFLEAHSGYALASLTAEVRPWEQKSAPYRASLRAMGCDESPVHPEGGTTALWLDAASIAAQRFHLLQPLFASNAPRLELSPAQREVLELAALGFEDARIAEALDVALDTIRKRWRAIHERVLDRMPELFSSSPVRDAGSRNRAVRGPEKRRTLVEFARTHPEELRP